VIKHFLGSILFAENKVHLVMPKTVCVNLLELMNLESSNFSAQEHIVLAINTLLSFDRSLMTSIKIYIAK
jgi:hypothetical protein